MYKQHYPNPFIGWPNDEYYPIYPPSLPKPTLIIPYKPTSDKIAEHNDQGDNDLLSKDDSYLFDEKKTSENAAYKKRNIYKSILRNMMRYIKKNRESLTQLLIEKGYTYLEINNGFEKIRKYNEMERNKGNKKRSQSILKRISSEKTIYTYILKESLDNAIKEWNKGNSGKISVSNKSIYAEVYKKYFDTTCSLLGLSENRIPPKRLISPNNS